MAVYTHFGGMPGLWRAVRQEGFTRLAQRLDGVERTEDPVRDLTAIGSAYVANALANPDLYQTMFGSPAGLDDPEAAAAPFGVLIAGVSRARADGRFAPAQPIPQPLPLNCGHSPTGCSCSCSPARCRWTA